MQIPTKQGPYEVTAFSIKCYQRDYPHVKVEQEFTKMANWCRANPHKRKTMAGMERFIVNWLNKITPPVKPGQRAHRDAVDAEFEQELRQRRPARPEVAMAELQRAKDMLRMR